MISPQRRIWIYPVSRDAVEIIILGGIPIATPRPEDDIATVFAAIRKLADEWQGFVRTETIVMGSTVLGLRARVGPMAIHDDPVAEALRMMHGRRGISWSGGDGAAQSLGMVGVW